MSTLLLLLLLGMAGAAGLAVYFVSRKRIEQLEVDARALTEQVERGRRQLRENEERFQTLVERSPDALFIHRGGKIVFHNPAASSLLGYARADELRGRPLVELIHSGESDMLTHPGDEQGVEEIHWVHREGRLVLGEVVTFPLVFDGQPARVSIVRDITERKHLREKLQTADRMAAIGSLAAGVAHEINNPLSFMLSNVRFVRDELQALVEEVDDKTRERLKEIQEALQETQEGGDRVSEIVRDLRTFARGDDGKRSPVNVHTVLDLCGNIARSQLRHRAQLVKRYGEVPAIYASESRLGQLFLNLIINAAQAIPEGADAKQHEVRLTTWREGREQVVVEVKDTGVGIPPENLHRLFDPFFTTKPVGVGTGLGLSICRGIVASLGGRITVESEPGRGTSFKVFLPVGDPTTTPGAPLPVGSPHGEG
ncbi:two-component system sensor histidine kinase NtrB [Hyalangium versicolor]|uniref:two-component system sensor histidine kinase NtrB n=1 Tax=Hyalangium versicolor TaxID=2861190 RepID=UPI001CCB4E54|nr:ATP-binding protein [Hyalangium versicolor]